MSSNSIEDWFKELPPISRDWLVSALLSTVAVVLGFATVNQLYLDWYLINSSDMATDDMLYILGNRFAICISAIFLVRYATK